MLTPGTPEGGGACDGTETQRIADPAAAGRPGGRAGSMLIDPDTVPLVLGQVQAKDSSSPVPGDL